MRYLGNKESLTDEIVTLLRKENLLNINDRKVFLMHFVVPEQYQTALKIIVTLFLMII